MVATRLRDQDRLEGASNYVIWQARIKCLLDEPDLKAFIDGVVVLPVDADPLKAYKKNMAKAKRLILDRVRDHVVCHITCKGMAKEMCDALDTLYQGSSEQLKMYFQEKIWSMRMYKGEHINPFLAKLQETKDQLAAAGSTP